MRESIGNSFIFYFVIVFFALFILFFVGSLAYTKAFKVKNKIIDTIENYDGEIANGNKLNNDFETEINSKLSDIGYRIDDTATCSTNGRFNNYIALSKSSNSTYRYCIYERDINKKGKYYAVVTYMYFTVPIINAKLEFPVFGETKTFTELTN